MTFPLQQEIEDKISELLERLDYENARHRYEKALIVAEIEAVRNACRHPNKVPVSHTGHSFTKCTVCGREW